MFAVLGNMQFEAITGFQEYSQTSETSLPEHPRIDNKPRLQRTGENLDLITIKIRPNFLFGTPEVLIRTLQQARENADVLPLTFGNGNFIGNFVIATIQQTPTQMDNKGNYLIVDITLSLKEAIIDDVVAQRDIEAKKAAFANADNSPSVRTGTFGSLSDAQKANLLLAGSKALSGQLNSDTNQAVSNPSKRNQKFKQVSQNCSAMATLLNKAQKIIFDNNGLRPRAEGIFNNIRGSLRSIERLQNAANVRSVSDANLANQDLQNATRSLSGSSSLLAGIKVTRKSS